MKATDKRKANAEKRAVWLRNYQRARGRAQTRLARQFPDQYKAILEQERLSDEANGKAWLDITGATDNSDGVSTDCLESLWTRESRFDHFAQNPKSSAFGIAQLLGERSRNPELQVLRGLRYIDVRYGSPCKALRHHKRVGNY